MNTIAYLKEVYGYSQPIFLKDIRIGRKSKTSIRKDLSRAVQEGKIMRKGQGVYYFSEAGELNGTVSFEEVVEYRFIKNDYGLKGLDLDIYGYYTGQTFLNQIGISQQVPAMLEITTNKTSCKRLFSFSGYEAILRKGRIEINRFNYKALQFFDMFYFLSNEEVKENKGLLFKYINDNLGKKDFEQYISFYPNRVFKLIIEEGLINAFK